VYEAAEFKTCPSAILTSLSLYVWDPPISYEAIEFSMWDPPISHPHPSLSLSVRMGPITLLLLEPHPRLVVAAPVVEVLRRWRGKRLLALGQQLRSSVLGR
jgi:hypothetical protein